MERGRKFIFLGKLSLTLVNGGSKIKRSNSKVKVTGNANVKIVVRAYLRQKCIDFNQSINEKIKWSK